MLSALLAGYEERLKPFLLKKQDGALRFTSYFAPKSWRGLIVRDVIANVASVPVLAKLMLGSAFRDDLNLPAYG